MWSFTRVVFFICCVPEEEAWEARTESSKAEDGVLAPTTINTHTEPQLEVKTRPSNLKVLWAKSSRTKYYVILHSHQLAESLVPKFPQIQRGTISHI